MVNGLRPGQLTGYFLAITFFYLFIKTFFIQTFSNRKQKSFLYWAFLVGYFIIIVAFMCIMTNILGADACKDAEGIPIDSAVLSLTLKTLVACVVIFGSMIGILQAFPGWKAPFSNTIGYALSFGVNSAFTKLLKSKLPEIVRKIFDDKSLMINEITPENWEPFLKKMSENDILEYDYEIIQGKLPKGDPLRDTVPGNANDGESGRLQEVQGAIKKLYRRVVIKESIAEFLWYGLTGALVITVIHNNLMNTNGWCKSAVADAKKNYDEILEDETKRNLPVSK